MTSLSRGIKLVLKDLDDENYADTQSSFGALNSVLTDSGSTCSRRRRAVRVRIGRARLGVGLQRFDPL